MAPKQSRTSKLESKESQPPLKHNQDSTDSEKKLDAQNTHSGQDESTTGDKRKKNSTDETAHKVQKTKKDEQASNLDAKVQATPEAVLKFLLSDKAVDICRSKDELDDISERGSDLKTYSDLHSPFEELLCAVILSRPISHRLGLRTIRTVLNPPYSFNDTHSIRQAGSEKIRQALDDAHTQHKGKTSEEIELLAEAFEKNEWDDDLEKIRKHGKAGVGEERDLLRKSIKGLGKTGLDIFYRRIQWKWEEAFPFVDERSEKALEKLGLPSDADKLLEMIDRIADSPTEPDESDNGEEIGRRQFVVSLERALSADLEKKVDELLKNVES